jgi:hypothetical protein
MPRGHAAWRRQRLAATGTLDVDLRSASTDDILSWRDRIVAEAAERMNGADVEAAIDVLAMLEFATIDDRTLQMTDGLLPRIAGARRVVASFDPKRVPQADELVIVYGNYPHTFASVVANNPVKRHGGSGTIASNPTRGGPAWIRSS